MVKRVWILSVLVLTGFCQRGWTAGDLFPIQMMPLVIDAPADTSINATMPGCWAMIELPPATIEMNGCMGPIDFMVFTPFDTLIGNGGKASFQYGTHNVIYQGQDTCGNTALDTMVLSVIDTIPPTAVCTGTRTVSLDGNGMGILPAFVFDGGSTDACFLYYKVKRLVPPNGYDCTTPDNPNYLFDDEVKFCCEDLNDTIMVVLRVYDLEPPSGPVSDTTLSGRFSDCMTSVIIRDKAPPVLTCPPDITIECGEHIDFDTLGLPTVVDNCDSISFDISIERDLDQCGTGQFRRVIIGTDGGGQSDTCTQIIFVENNTPFNGNDTNDLIWPEAYVTIYDCIFVPDTSMAGGPIIKDDECSMVSVSWEDEVYTFSRGACSKVIRTFKVLDWCQYDPKVSSACTPANGCWTFEQIIKVVDTVPPTIMRPNDTIVDYLKPGCTDMLVTLDSATADTCFFGEIITFEIQLDFYSDDIIDVTIDGPDGTFVYPVGKHKVIYFATDECGNTSIDTMMLEVKDRVLPTSISKSGINIALTDMGNGMVMTSIWAIDLNASSYDNCTSQDMLVYSFSPDTSDKERVFNCDSIGIRQVRLYVTDKCGNQDFVTTMVLVEDTGGHCPTNITRTSVSGLVQRHDGMTLKDVQVQLSSTCMNEMASTNDSGEYMHDNLERSITYSLKAEMSDNALLGITTKDVVLIQRHLLGIESFNEVSQYLAADVNQSGHVSTGDIINLRRLIIGHVTSFPKGSEWLFIPADWSFQNPSDPWANPWPSKFTLSNLQDPTKVNFTGYKLGDVDMSYSGLNNNGTRSKENIDFGLAFDKDKNILSIANTKEIWLSGLQMSLELVGIDNQMIVVRSTLENWSEENYRYDAQTGEIHISWHAQEGEWFPADDFLWIECTNLNSEGLSFSATLTDKLPAEVYDSKLATYAISLNKSSNDQQGTISSMEVKPNPFHSNFNLEFYSMVSSDAARVKVIDLLGKVIYQSEVMIDAGWNTHNLLFDENVPGGVYMLQLITPHTQMEVRVIKSR